MIFEECLILAEEDGDDYINSNELATQVAEHPLNAESIDLIGLATTGIEYA